MLIVLSVSIHTLYKSLQIFYRFIKFSFYKLRIQKFMDNVDSSMGFHSYFLHTLSSLSVYNLGFDGPCDRYFFLTVKENLLN